MAIFSSENAYRGIKIRPKSLSAHVFPGKAHFSKPKSGQKIEQFFTSKYGRFACPSAQYGLRFGSLPARRDRRSCQEVCENGHPPRRFFAGLHTLSGRNSPLCSYANCSGQAKTPPILFVGTSPLHPHQSLSACACRARHRPKYPFHSG